MYSISLELMVSVPSLGNQCDGLHLLGVNTVWTSSLGSQYYGLHLLGVNTVWTSSLGSQYYGLHLLGVNTVGSISWESMLLAAILVSKCYGLHL